MTQKMHPGTLSVLEAELARRPNTELVCFDVFDTLLTRIQGEPRSLFLRLGETLRAEGEISVSPGEFAGARVRAERRARQHVIPPADVTLSQVYDELVHSCPEFWPRVNRLIEAELEAESETLRRIPYAEQMVALARKHSKSIAFVSDMYLPKSFICSQLIVHGLIEAGDPLYVSNDCGYKKSHGGALFRFVLRDLGVESSSALHVGDSQRDDFEAALSIGMSAILVKEAHPNRYEDALNTAAWESGNGGSLLAGASRLTRLSFQNNYQPDAMLRVLAGVAAPLLLGYTLWLLGRAAASGLRRLYFLSREGEVVYVLAEIMNQRLRLGMDLRYLYVSRSSINLAVLTEPNWINLSWALTHAGGHRLRGILKRVGLKPEDIASGLLEIGLPEERWSTRLSDHEYDALVDLLLSERAQRILSRRAADARKVIEAYLAENHFFDDQGVGLVDTTGTGSQMRTLHFLRREKTVAETLGFLCFRSWKPSLHDVGFPEIMSYLGDQRSGRGFTGLTGLTQMLEIFALTDYGTVIGYKQGVHGVQPIVAEASTPIRQFCSVDALREPLLTFATSLPVDSQLLGAQYDLRPGIVKAVQLFWNEPSTDEAIYWGGFPFETGAGLEADHHELAPPLALNDVYLMALGKPARHSAWYVWRSARQYRSALPIRSFLQMQRVIRHKASRLWPLSRH